MTGALLSCRGDAQLHAAIVAARFVGDDSSSRAAIVKILAEPLAARGLGLSWREEAGRHLARLGDPRDLLATVEVPAGRFTMGAADHPNNAPPHELDLPAFRIARFPIVNRIYRDFVAATGRFWRSTDGLLAERANAPAVDLTWHDAREFCRWLTTRWQASGHIASDEIVRLPSEPEWEKAARSGDARRYPWGADWAHDHQNGEEAGLNTTCAVGLFPSGASPYGAEDMTGQVWEWTTTLWGEDMTTPSFAYPYRADDGREDRESPAAMRRVLRGGAFSSPAFKACTTYRGSLEPAGFWRGNGFRFVVARHGRG
jgi:iron(II)-dependent oxidoreductase